MYFNTVVTPFLSPVVELSAPQAKAALVGNLIASGGAKQRNQQVAAVRAGANIENFGGEENWFSGDFAVPGHSGLTLAKNRFSPAKSDLFVDPAKSDYRLAEQALPEAKTTLALDQLKILPVLALRGTDASAPLVWQYRHPANKEKREDAKALVIGAYGK